MTVQELIEALENLDRNLEVSVEGCDCLRKATGVTNFENNVLITSF